MRFPKPFAKSVALVVAPALLICMTAQTAVAAMVATERVVHAASDPDARARLQNFLDREDVQKVLARWSVSPEEAKARVAALTDNEVSDIAGRLDAMPAGGYVVGLIVGAILLVFFVLLLTDLLGLTDVFPFIKKKHKE